MARSRRLVFINRYYYPDHSATSQILTDLAEALAARGWEVSVIASRLRYDDTRTLLPVTETRRGVLIRRVSTTRLGRAGLARRAIDYASFYVAAFGVLLRRLRRGDIVVAKTDPPLLSVIAGLTAWVRGAALVNWLQDLYPEVAAELGMPVMRGPVGGMFRRLRNASLRHASANVVIGERMARKLLSEKVPADRVHVVPNWTDENAIAPMARGASPLRTEWGLGDKFVVGYSGNLGRAHEFDTLLGAAQLLRHHTEIVFLMIGGGHGAASLAKEVRRRGLAAQFSFQPYQPRDQLATSLGAADIHWLSLRPELEGLIVPSKYYGIAAAGRAVIAIADPDGEIGGLVAREGCGIVIEPGDSASLAQAILACVSGELDVDRMGEAARALILRDYGRAAAFDRWEALLNEFG